MLLATLTVAASLCAPEDTRVTTSEELAAALASARAGARILVAPGEYRGSFSASGRSGREGAPIVIAAEDPARPPVIAGPVQLSDVAWIEISGLVITGSQTNGLNIDDGGTFDTPSHHVVVRDVTVRDIGARGNEDGIKLSGLDDFVLERCSVERWGRGGSGIDMVGCHRGAVRACTLRDREDDAAASGLQMKGGTRAIEVLACRFEHAGQRAVHIGGSTDPRYFRPRAEGFEAREITVEGCTFVGSEAPVAFVGADGARVAFNTFYRPTKWIARILQETRAEGFVPCRNGVFTDNLIAYRASELSSTPINVGSATAPETFELARNYWYCIDEPARAVPKLPLEQRDAAGGGDPRFTDVERGDFTLAAISPARAFGAHAAPGAARAR